VLLLVPSCLSSWPFALSALQPLCPSVLVLGGSWFRWSLVMMNRGKSLAKRCHDTLTKRGTCQLLFCHVVVRPPFLCPVILSDGDGAGALRRLHEAPGVPFREEVRVRWGAADGLLFWRTSAAQGQNLHARFQFLASCLSATAGCGEDIAVVVAIL